MIFEKVPIGKVKDYWDKNPCNLNYSADPLGTLKCFRDLEKKKYEIEPHIPEFAEFRKWKGKKVLEIGCGIGTDTISFARAGAKVTAVDISEESLKIAKMRADIHGFKKDISFYLANAEELSKTVPARPYDLVYSFGVLHHTPHPERAIEEIKKFCWSQTIVKVMLYHRFSWPVVWILFQGKGAFWKMDELIARYSESRNCPITYTYSLSGIKKLFRDFELTDLSVKYPPSEANFFRRLYKKSRLFRNLAYPLIDFLGKPLGWHLCVTAKVKV